MKKPYDLSCTEDIYRLVKESEIEAFHVCEENGENLIPEEWEFELIGPKCHILKVTIRKKGNSAYKVFINNSLYSIIRKNKVNIVNKLENIISANDKK
ncbi:hypothetical protein DFR86_10090 [Acidianus sulfidivorans JP7]|uniref:Uncharacterized protein n=1 Tax=Acidianus sulfidivorans JP7 TaxID=619593 RepID=A0A2U9IPF3_9CREN|nr:hypothetical protein [Acidianus sulfidivorans]AWR97854.1 hypothetical protein DFR86_10090 [Acidianus sulfidivorans JP7]